MRTSKEAEGKNLSPGRYCPECGEVYDEEDWLDVDLWIFWGLGDAQPDDWEIDLELFADADYEGLVAHRRARLARSPGDLFTLLELGEAHLLNGEADRVIDLLAEPQRRHPEDRDVQRLMLDALFAAGKDETHFEWSAPLLPVYRVGPETLDRCHAYLEAEGRPRSIYHLLDLFDDGYAVFREDDLVAALRRDRRFRVRKRKSGTKVGLRKKRKPRRKRWPR